MDVFDKTSDNEANTQPDIVENEDGSISVGGKKYENWMEVAKGKLHADTFIETLKGEKHSVEERLNKLDSQGTMLQNIEERLKNLPISSIQDDLKARDDLEDVGIKNDKGGDRPDPRFKELEDQILTLRQEQLVKEKQEKLKEALIDTFGGKEQAKEAWDKYQKSPFYDEDIAKEFAIKDPVKLANQVKLTVGENVQAPKPGAPKPATVRSMPTSAAASLKGGGEEYAKLYKKMKKQPNRWTLEDQARMVELYDTHGSSMFEGTEDRILKLE